MEAAHVQNVSAKRFPEVLARTFLTAVGLGTQYGIWTPQKLYWVKVHHLQPSAVAVS